jgi:hypothetical protein
LITVVFRDLSVSAKELFSSYIQNDELVVTRVIALSSGKIAAKYHGVTLKHEAFQGVREIASAVDLKKAYADLRASAEYAALPAVTKKEEALDSLRQWELTHPQLCSHLRDDGQFFGFTEVAQGYLGRYTRMIRIPAVRDAADDVAESRGSPITQLMDLVVRRSLAQREDFVALKADIDAKYREIIDPSKSVEVGALAAALTATLRNFVPDGGVALSWGRAPALDLALPKAEVRICEDGHLSPIDRTGHGMQRAVIITLLQHLAIQAEQPAAGPAGASTGDGVIESPALLLLLEEPELYQHPNRQRHFASLLARLAAGTVPGGATRTQVMYCTHSPLFVGLDRFDHIRLLRKIAVAGKAAKAVSIAAVPLDAIAKELWNNTDKKAPPYSASTLRPRLAAVMTPWVNEGFFAEVVVLVEGEGDRAVLLAVADYLGLDYEAAGVSIVPCMGKPNLDRPLLIFRALGIPVYVMWDSDQGGDDSKPEQNRALLRLLGRKEEDWPSFIDERAACLATNLEKTLAAELGAAVWSEHLTAAAEDTGLSAKQAKKNPIALRSIIAKAKAAGSGSPTLEEIVARVWALRPAPVSVTPGSLSVTHVPIAAAAVSPG